MKADCPFIIAVGDTHGTDHWWRVYERFAGDANLEAFVFIGDYFDSYDIGAKRQIQNFREITSIAENDERIKLLIGNHDFHYMKHVIQRYSGYQQKYAPLITEELQPHIDSGLLRPVYRHNDWLFTHAGVTNTWISEWYDYHPQDKLIDYYVYWLWNDNREVFGFIDKGDRTNPYGDNVYQGPMWVRPSSLLTDNLEGFNQVVGHTRFPDIRHERGVDDEQIVFIDTMEDNPSFLVIQEGRATTHKLVL